MTRRDTPIEVALKGASAGLAGTLVLTVVMRAFAALIESLPRSQTEDRSSPNLRASAAPPAQLVGKIAQGVFERDLPPVIQSTLGQALHWVYGATWGVVYGIVQGSVGLPAALHGTVLGLIVWLVGPLGVVPAMKLSSQAASRETPQLIRSLMFHQVYGWAVALAFNLLTRPIELTNHEAAMNRLSRRQLLRATPLMLAAVSAPWAPRLERLAAACQDLTAEPGSPCEPPIEDAAAVPADFSPWWVQTFLATKLWPTKSELDSPLGPVTVGQYMLVQTPQDGSRLRVWDPRNNVIGYIGTEAVGPVDPPVWAEYLNGQDGRWIDVTLSVPQHAVAMQGDLALRESLVTAGLRGETRPGHYQILRRVYNETMDSRTVPGLTDSYLLKNVLFTQYFTGDGAAIHYNWWGPPYGFGRPGSHGCLGMMYDDSKFYWDWADIGVPIVVHA